MSTIDIFNRSGLAGHARLSGFLAGLVARVRNYTSYRKTFLELDHLTDRELADLGLSRHQLRDVAFHVAYDN
ncbi:MAG: DUF1127 domain-containing protein [Boseongicola sp.]